MNRKNIAGQHWRLGCCWNAKTHTHTPGSPQAETERQRTWEQREIGHRRRQGTPRLGGSNGTHDTRGQGCAYTKQRHGTLSLAAGKTLCVVRISLWTTCTLCGRRCRWSCSASKLCCQAQEANSSKTHATQRISPSKCNANEARQRQKQVTA